MWEEFHSVKSAFCSRRTSSAPKDQAPDRLRRRRSTNVKKRPFPTNEQPRSVKQAFPGPRTGIGEKVRTLPNGTAPTCQGPATSRRSMGSVRLRAAEQIVVQPHLGTDQSSRLILSWRSTTLSYILTGLQTGHPDRKVLGTYRILTSSDVPYYPVQISDPRVLGTVDR